MGLQISGLIGDKSISGGMGFVEPVACKFRHQIKDIFGLILRDIVFCSPLHEFTTLFFHDLGDFLSHGAPENIGIAQAVAGQDVGNLHDLFLIDNDPVRFFKNRLDLGKRVFGRPSSMFGFNKGVHHA